MSKSMLNRVTIAKPCAMNWEAMTGDERQRYCAHCDKHVYNLSQLTRPQAEALLMQTKGNLCARFERRADGSILTADEVASSPRFNRKFLRMASAMVSAALSLSPTLAAKPIRNLPGVQEQDKKEETPQSQENGKPAKVFGTVFDEAKAVIPNAKIKLIQFDTKQEIAASSLADGTYEFSAVPRGLYHLLIEVPGFIKFQLEGIALQNGQVKQIDAVMKIGFVGEVVTIEPVPKRAVQQAWQIILFPFRKLKAFTQ